MLLDMATPKWVIHLVNDAWQRATGISQEMAAGSHFWDLFEPPAPAQVCLAGSASVPVYVADYGAQLAAAYM